MIESLIVVLIIVAIFGVLVWAVGTYLPAPAALPQRHHPDHHPDRDTDLRCKDSGCINI